MRRQPRRRERPAGRTAGTDPSGPGPAHPWCSRGILDGDGACVVVGQILREQIRAQQTEEIQPVRRDSVRPPLGDGARRDAADFRDFARAAEFVDERSVIHAAILAD